jgi:AraC-like DNA-binding protein
MLRLDTAERAIGMFERQHGLNVTIHDLVGNLSPFLRPDRFYHRSPLCLAAKARGSLGSCLEFEKNRVRQALATLPEGRVHLCPASLIEWVVPIFEAGKLAWVIYAGPRLPGKNLPSAVHDWPGRRSTPSRSTTSLAVPTVEEEEAQMILEHLRQLAARLQKWVHEAALQPVIGPGSSSGENEDVALTRQNAIRHFVEDGYSRPLRLPLLARKLGLSAGRTSHLVREVCGLSFRELVIQRRLKAAMELLRQSGLSVLEIALATGFEDVAHFHRLFRRRIGTTPHKYRLAGQA